MSLPAPIGQCIAHCLCGEVFLALQAAMPERPTVNGKLHTTPPCPGCKRPDAWTMLDYEPSEVEHFRRNKECKTSFVG